MELNNIIIPSLKELCDSALCHTFNVEVLDYVPEALEQQRYFYYPTVFYVTKLFTADEAKQNIRKYFIKNACDWRGRNGVIEGSLETIWTSAERDTFMSLGFNTVRYLADINKNVVESAYIHVENRIRIISEFLLEQAISIVAKYIMHKTIEHADEPEKQKHYFDTHIITYFETLCHMGYLNFDKYERKYSFRGNTTIKDLPSWESNIVTLFSTVE